MPKTAKKIAFQVLTGSLTLIIFFHLSVMAKWIPYDIAWGGRLENDAQMYVFESISILINALLITVLLLKINFIAHPIPEKIINGILWFFAALFLLNTAGNIVAKTDFEKLFAFVTFLFAFLIWVILKKDK